MSYYEPNLYCSDSISNNNDQYGHDQLYGHNGRYSYATYYSFVDLNSHVAWDEPNPTRQSQYGYDYQNGYGDQYGYEQAANGLTYNSYNQMVTEPYTGNNCDYNYNYQDGYGQIAHRPYNNYGCLNSQHAWEFQQFAPQSQYDQQVGQTQVAEEIVDPFGGFIDIFEKFIDMNKIIQKGVADLATHLSNFRSHLKTFEIQRHQGKLEEPNHLNLDHCLREQVMEVRPFVILPSEEEDNMVGLTLENIESDHHVLECPVDKIVHIDMIVGDKAGFNNLLPVDFDLEVEKSQLRLLIENGHVVSSEDYPFREIKHVDMNIGEKADLVKRLSAKFEIMTIIGQMNTHGEHEGSAHMKAEKKKLNLSHPLWSIMIGLEKFEIHAENTKHSTLGVKHGWPPP
ncbi:hypothetical protein M0R45_035645 [Rubus argutus]|uniref:Uncharacterized protein n=1 Tax=Rubus argutus TaxID=59490 RepID=A0AAW1VTR6_RUBAR